MEKDRLSRHRSRRQSLESSVLKFKNVNFIVGEGENKKHILTDVNGKVKFGHVLAIMGPSGAGKTTLISALTLDAYYGKATGIVTLNGIPLTDEIFKEHCYVVKQHDKHWPYLTCRETLMYAAELFDIAAKSKIAPIVEDVINKMGLAACADTRCARMSGGEQRRLSIGIALLKQPTLLFLDEPTSGLDAAAAVNIMLEIVRVAREERLIIVCTIHQPSTKVYNGFDELMLMSKGREAFAGPVNEAVPYFESVGFPCPPTTNPAEFFLDLVNADFSDEAAVVKLLDDWEERKPGAGNSSHHKKGFYEDDGGQTGVVNYEGRSFSSELAIMFRRHTTLLLRDPILYIGRCVIFVFANIFFGLVYWSARNKTQDQMMNKMWTQVWFCSVTTNMGCVVVYVLNDEFKSILRDTKNGMMTGVSYFIAKSLLSLPFMLIFALCSLGIPSFLIQDTPGTVFGMYTLVYAANYFVFESVAECLSVWLDNPILGMLLFMNFWFGSFLFGGFLIPERDLYYPFALFYHIMPFSYYTRSAVYLVFSSITFETCTDPTVFIVCLQETTEGGGVDGSDALAAFNNVLPLIDNEDTIGRDILALLAIGLFYKVLYAFGVILKTKQVARIHAE